MVSINFITCLYFPTNLSVRIFLIYSSSTSSCCTSCDYLLLSYGQLVGFEKYWILVAANSSIRLQGFLDAITYGLTEGVARRWTKSFYSIFIIPFPNCFKCFLSNHSRSSQENSSIPSKSYPSHDSSILFCPEGYLWDRLVPSEQPQSSHDSVSDSGYYTPFTTSRDLYFTSGNNIPYLPRERDYLSNKINI